uniref:cAMP-dependent protein kinase inhibitor n=1 Tax=Neogobius melanostomus TaxID=47308 RepID=A0A8C6TCZ1_9GOBI
MTDVEATYEGFLASQRSGRRNAVHELETTAGEGATDLSQSLAQLNINKSEEEDDTKNSPESPSKEEKTQGEGS